MAGPDDTVALCARVAALEAQVKRLADELALYRITASYGPAVDGGAGRIAAALWTPDGSYDVDGGRWDGRAAIAGMTSAATTQGAIRNGGAHVTSLPRVSVDGDTAVATCHGRLYLKQEGGYGAWRIAANRWEFVRTAEGWRVARRTNRLLDGTEPGRELLRRGFDDPDTPTG